MRIRPFPSLIALLTLINHLAAGQIMDPYFTPPSGLYAQGIVYTIGPQQSDGKRVVSGPFTRVNGTTANRLVRLDASGNLDQLFTQNVGAASMVNRAKLLSGGQYLLSVSNGSLTAGNLTRTALLRLNSDGTADAAFTAGNGPSGGSGVRDFAVQADGKIVVVGGFSSFNGAAAASVVRLTSSGGVDATFNAGAGTGGATTDLAYSALVQADDRIVVGGHFATFNGQAANGLIRLNADGTIDPSFTSPFNQAVTRVEGVIQQPDGKLLVYGLLSVNSTTHPVPGIVRLLTSGSLDPSFSAPTFLDARITTGTVNGPAVVLQPDGKLIVAGGFTVTGANHLARLNADGTQDLSFQTGVGANGNPNSIGLQANGSIWVGGAFSTYDGADVSFVQLASNGARDIAFTPTIQSAGTVTAMIRQPDSQLIIGGNFTEINGQPIHRLARLTETGTMDAAFVAASGGVPAPVTSLALQSDGRILAGTTQGTFRFFANGNPDASFSFLGSTSALALQADGQILIGGNFAVTSGGVVYSRLVRLNSMGVVDQAFVRPTTGTWVPNSTEAILIQPDGRIVVAGTFVPSGQAVTTRLVRYDATGALDATFNNLASFSATSGSVIISPRIYSLALQPDGKILAGGGFGSVDGNTRVNLARFTATGAVDLTFTLSAPLGINGSVQSIVYQPNGRILIGGGITCAGPNGTIYGVIRVLANGQLDNTYGDSVTPNSVVSSIVLQPDGGIMIAGSFTAIAGQSAFGIARIAAANVLQNTPQVTSSFRVEVWPIPTQNILHLSANSGLLVVATELFDASGRSVRQFKPTNVNHFDLDVSGLTEGVYFLRVLTNNGSFVSRVVIGTY